MPAETFLMDIPGSPFRFRDVLIDYDGPLVFSIESPRLGSIWVFVAVDDTGESTTYLASQVAPLVYQAVASGRRDLRDAFVGEFSSPDTQAMVRYEAEEWAVLEYPLAEQPREEMLPNRGAKLQAPIEPFKAYDSSQLVALANTNQRACWALEVHPAATEPGEIGVSLLTEVLSGFQGSVWEGALEIRDRADKTTSDASVKHQTELIYQDSMAASFVAVLTAPTPESDGVLFYEDEGLLAETTSHVIDLIRLAALDAQGALDALRTSSRGMQREFRKLIKTVMRTEGGIAVDQAVPGRAVEQVRITPGEAQTVEALLSLEGDPVEVGPCEASLVGMNVESKNFSLRFKDPIPELGGETKLSGTLDKTHAKELLDYLPTLAVGTETRYWATVSVIPSDFGPDGASFIKSKLVWLEMIEDDSLPDTEL